MLKRKALARMERWKRTKTHQALLVSGARQVGKTFLIREFCKANYDNVVEINLVENEGAAQALSRASDSTDLFMRISTFSDVSLSKEGGVVFIDEVQEAPEIVTQVKFLLERGGIDYILSGSLLGVGLKRVRSLPVGFLSEIRMFPLDFEEYCWANGVNEDIISEARRCFDSRTPIDEFVNDRLMGLYHRYLVSGGMPDVVSAFIETGDVPRARELQSDILSLYRGDIAKYAGKRGRVVQRIFDLMPSEVSRQDKRFVIKDVENSSRFSRYDNDFTWLADAGVSIPVYDVNEPRYPLAASLDVSRFKLFMCDVGLLTCASNMNVVRDVLAQRPDVNFGAIYENAIAQELLAHGRGNRDGSLSYFKNHRLGELDFLIEDEHDKVVPLEVKSGKGYKRHSALTRVLETPNYAIDRAVVLCEGNVEQSEKIDYLPVYMAMFL